MLTTFRRIATSGFISFWRNGFVSVSSVVVMTITLFVVMSLLFINQLLDSSLTLLQEKVDINAYFVIDATEEDMREVEQAVAALPEVATVVFTSRDEALERFRERHADDAIELQALEELDDNPLLASLSIRAQDPSYYEQIARFLEKDSSVLSAEGEGVIAKVNFNDNRVAINRLRDVMHGIELFGIALSTALIIVSVIIVFNTIRMVIYMSREEIAVMRLVGASDMYIRGPFVVEGAMYGIISALIVLVLLYPLTMWLGPATERFFGAMNIFTYYTSNFGQLAVLLFVTGAVLGAFSSYLAVRKYLH
jgi:cell division transport system permease protein